MGLHLILKKKRDLYTDGLMSKGIFQYSSQNEEKEFLNCELFSTKSKLEEASGKSKSFGSGHYIESRALSFFSRLS